MLENKNLIDNISIIPDTNGHKAIACELCQKHSKCEEVNIIGDGINTAIIHDCKNFILNTRPNIIVCNDLHKAFESGEAEILAQDIIIKYSLGEELLPMLKTLLTKGYCITSCKEYFRKLLDVLEKEQCHAESFPSHSL